MSSQRPVVNIVNITGCSLFAPHFDPVRDGYDVVENGSADQEWDILIVFEAISGPATYKVRTGCVLFISGEPPEIGPHAHNFLRQFDKVFCAGIRTDAHTGLSNEQHFNNWHFGYSSARSGYRYSHADIRDLPLPEKTACLSTVTSNLNYLPMHIRRRMLIDRLSRDYAGLIDIFGRPHKFVEYKEDAILPYRFHLCIENCSVPGLWTEKIADALLSYSIPVYAGCSDIERYFPGATIAIDLDDYASTRKIIDEILEDGESLYRNRFEALVTARRRLIEDFDISALIRSHLQDHGGTPMRQVVLTPEAHLPFARARNSALRIRRQVRKIIWRHRVNRHG